jgi:Flp pilus assembly pilin Flp
MLTYLRRNGLKVYSATTATRKTQRGQGLVEYALILLFITLVVVAGVVLLAPVIEHGLSGVMPAL